MVDPGSDGGLHFRMVVEILQNPQTRRSKRVQLGCSTSCDTRYSYTRQARLVRFGSVAFCGTGICAGIRVGLIK